MKQPVFFLLSAFLLISALFGQHYKSRDEVPAPYRWNLQDLYPSSEKWEEQRADLLKKVDEFIRFKGTLGKGPESLAACLDDYFGILKELNRLSSYASMLKDEDLGDASRAQYSQLSADLGNRFAEKTAFLVPEIISIGEETLTSWIEQSPRLNDYDMFLKDVLRNARHTLSEPEETLLAMSYAIARTPSEVYGIFNNAEMPAPSIVFSNGDTVELSASTFEKYRTIPIREDRKLLFQTWFENYGRFKNTLGANLAGNARNHVFYARARKYSSSLEASLDGNNIPTAVYENLIHQIHQALPTLHRFLKLKKKMLGLDTLHYYDLYLPLTSGFSRSYSVEESQQIILEALKPMGQEYLEGLNRAFKERWIDYYPTKGKRSGAYSNGSAYDVHPYILMNWTDDYNALSTLAHELGHTMHSYFSNKYQPFPKADYSIFVAEIASTFNENLLNQYLVEKTKDKQMKLFLLSSYLERMRTTIFRQTLFAEFELELHRMIERGEPVSGEKLSQLYLDITRKYYGHDQGICIVDDFIAHEWAWIPHFYYNYYVYQYATSQIYSTAFAMKVFKKEKDAVKNYYKILKGGGSKYPIDLIRETGLDPLSSEAFDLTMERMNQVMDEIEKLIR